MFERYTETARRAVFFARYEASQFGKPYIDTEHLLLGVLREDRELAARLLRSGTESIRRQIEAQTAKAQKVSTSADLPLSRECKRALAFGAEEAERLRQKHIGTEHLLLGLLRETGCFAARLLNEQGVTLESAREHLRHLAVPSRDLALAAHLEQWLTERNARGDIRVVTQQRVGTATAQYAVYAVEPAQEHAEAAEIEQRIQSIVKEMERAIAGHDFEKARLCAEQERKERDALASLRKQFNLKEPAAPIPVLCIDIIGEEKFSEIHERCDAYVAEGVGEVWLLDPELKRACTVTKDAGLREFRGDVLRLETPLMELTLAAIFD